MTLQFASKGLSPSRIWSLTSSTQRSGTEIPSKSLEKMDKGFTKAMMTSWHGALSDQPVPGTEIVEKEINAERTWKKFAAPRSFPSSLAIVSPGTSAPLISFPLSRSLEHAIPHGPNFRNFKKCLDVVYMHRWKDSSFVLAICCGGGGGGGEGGQFWGTVLLFFISKSLIAGRANHNRPQVNQTIFASLAECDSLFWLIVNWR